MYPLKSFSLVVSWNTTSQLGFGFTVMRIKELIFFAAGTSVRLRLKRTG
jgi:hypothetical protein